MIAVINPAAGGGRALAKWSRIESRLQAEAGPFRVFVPDDVRHLAEAMPRFLAEGHREFLAAGGDGTVSAVLAAITIGADDRQLAETTVGAVGLGSSNDFHKPVRDAIEGVPCRADFGRARLHDVGLLDYEDARGFARTRPWFINASIGVAAEANHLFNHPDRALRRLKRISTAAAIGYAALRAILANRPYDLLLTIDGRRCASCGVRNLGIVKNPHFAGALRYDTPHRPDSGDFDVHRLGATSRAGLLHALVRLSRGRFAGGHGARSWTGRRLTVRNGGAPFLVECDGEVVEARSARFSIMTRKVRLCS